MPDWLMVLLVWGLAITTWMVVLIGSREHVEMREMDEEERG